MKNECVLNNDYLFRIDLLSRDEKYQLMRDLECLHSFNVCNVTNKIDKLSCQIEDEKCATLEHY